MTIRVQAPSDLEAGYTFEAEADGKTYTVTVPEGGVTAGQEFDAEATEVQAAVPAPAASGPKEWNSGLCDCCSTCPCPFFMAWCLPLIFTGQVLQRLKLNVIGQPGNHENTCMIYTVVTIVAYVLFLIFSAVARGAYVVSSFIGIFWIVAVTLARNHMRKKYNIKPSCAGESVLDDCCCAYWCGCCTIIQMHRETHDEKQHKYNIATKTGLDDDAPEIV